jgi:hypothetical protein
MRVNPLYTDERKRYREYKTQGQVCPEENQKRCSYHAISAGHADTGAKYATLNLAKRGRCSLPDVSEDTFGGIPQRNRIYRQP